jgi:hypothetical protein
MDMSSFICILINPQGINYQFKWTLNGTRMPSEIVDVISTHRLLSFLLSFLLIDCFKWQRPFTKGECAAHMFRGLFKLSIYMLKDVVKRFYKVHEQWTAKQVGQCNPIMLDRLPKKTLFFFTFCRVKTM